MQDIKKYLDSLPDNTIFLDLSNHSLSEIPDLSRFINLKYLDCSRNNLTKLPENLPDSLETLYCDFNPLIKLNNLPPNLIMLGCSNCKLIELPENLPNSLKDLYCNNNNISYLPECISKLSKEMYHLRCEYNNLKILPFIFGDEGIDMNFSNNPCINNIYTELKNNNHPVYMKFIEDDQIKTCEYICKKNYELLKSITAEIL